jgi:hypothetical protein
MLTIQYKLQEVIIIGKKSKRNDDEWFEIVAKQLDSGMRPRDFCTTFGVEYKTFIKARARVKAKVQIEKELKAGTSFIDKIQQMEKEPLTNIYNNQQNLENLKSSVITGKDIVNDLSSIKEKNNYNRLLGANDVLELMTDTIIRKTQYVLDNELNKYINFMGVEKDLKQINVGKLKDLSISVLRIVYENDMKKRRLELEIIRSNMDAERLLIEKEKLQLEKIKLGLVKDESHSSENGFVDALKQQNDIWEDEYEEVAE